MGKKVVYLDGNDGLLILVGGKYLRFLGWDNGVPRDQFGHHSSHGFNTKGKWSHIQ